MDTRKLKISAVLVSLVLFGVILVRGQSINQSGLSGFTWYNGTNTNIHEIYRDGIQYRPQYVATVTCLIEGSRYVAYGSSGEALYNETTAYDCIQNALNYSSFNGAGIVTWLKARVHNNTNVELGPGIWDIGANSLKIPNKCALMGQSVESTRITGSNSPIIRNMWMNTTYGGYIADTQIVGSGTPYYGIKWNITDASYPTGETSGSGMLGIRDVMIRDTNHALWFRTASGSNAVFRINNVRSASQKWYFERVFDSMVIGGSQNSLQLDSCTAIHFVSGYTGGGLKASLNITGGSANWPNRGLIFTNWRFDNPLRTWLSLTGYVNSVEFVGCMCSNINWNSVNNTYSGVILGGNTHHISIVGTTFTNTLEAAHAATLKYVIEEQSGSHNNTFLGNTYQDNMRRGIKLWDRATGRIYKSWDYTVSYWERPYGTSHGTAEASNDDWIKHGLDPSLAVDMGNCTITLTVQESDAPYAAQVKAVNGTKFQLYLYDIAAAGVENVDKTIDWVAMYEP